MEDLENRLQLGSPTTIAQIFSKIVQKIGTKHSDGLKDYPELKFLKEKCLNSDPVISEISGRAIVKLVEDGVLPVESTIADFVSATSSMKCYSSLTNVLGDLLYIKWKRRHLDKPSSFEYNLCSHQHPFITLMAENPNMCTFVLNKIRSLHCSQNELPVNELFRPVYLFGLYHPSNSMALFKHRIWTFLLNQEQLDETAFFDMLSWLQVQTRDLIESTSELLDDVLTLASSGETSLNIDILILWQVTVLYYLAVNKLDILPTICCLRKVLQTKICSLTTNCILLMFSKIIDVCTPIHLKDVLDLCETVLLQAPSDPYIIETLRSSLLHWLASPCILIEDAHKTAETIFNDTSLISNARQRNDDSTNFPGSFHKEITSNSILFVSIEICQLSSHLKNRSRLINWLDDIQRCPLLFIEDIFNFLCGLLMLDRLDEEIASKTFVLILGHVEKNISLAPKLLTIILYKLSNTRHPRLRFELLAALPKMVVIRENVPKVMSTLQAVSKGSENLFNVGLKLMYDAWKEDSMCYPFLEGLLVGGDAFKRKWERYVIKSHVIKQLCLEKPELYGEEMVAHLSKILNECKDDNGSLPSALAIEAVTILCRAEVVNVIQTWAILSPMFKNDLRIPVVKSLCLLIQEISQLSYTESYTELYKDVNNQLWEYVETGDPEICEAALSSLTSFGLERICAYLPEEYLALGTAPKSVPTDVYLVPGKTWIDFLIKQRVSSAAVNFVTKMISVEIDGYLKYVYQTKGTKEPLNYGYLPTHSVLRGVGEFIKTWSNKWTGSIHDKVYLACLKILSTEFSKPLPPLDWCFLQELMHDRKTKSYCVDMASHQVVISGTARRLMENYINAVTQNPQDEDIVYIYRNLTHLANSMQPVILKPFFEITIWSVIKSYSSTQDPSMLNEIMDILKTVLKHNNIQETNKTTIVQVLTAIIHVTDIKSQLFEALMQTVTVAPDEIFESVVNLKSNSDEDWLEKVTKARCYLAKNSDISPLSWLDEVIDVTSQKMRSPSLWKEIGSVFKSHVNNAKECALWILHLIGQIQAKVADRCEERQLVYYFDVFVTAVVQFSGYDAFMKENAANVDQRMRELFPQAFVALLRDDGWNVCTIQALEWLFHMNSEVGVPKDYRVLFGLSLRALRHDPEFTKNPRWMKYLSCITDFQ